MTTSRLPHMWLRYKSVRKPRTSTRIHSQTRAHYHAHASLARVHKTHWQAIAGDHAHAHVQITRQGVLCEIWKFVSQPLLFGVVGSYLDFRKISGGTPSITSSWNKRCSGAPILFAVSLLRHILERNFSRESRVARPNHCGLFGYPWH